MKNLNADAYYLSQSEPNQGCLLALRNLIMEMDPAISESIKWSIPCFSYRKKMFCFLSIEKKSNDPYLLLVEGARIDHPVLEQGDRKRMKILRIDPNMDIPTQLIQNILNQALELYQ